MALSSRLGWKAADSVQSTAEGAVDDHGHEDEGCREKAILEVKQKKAAASKKKGEEDMKSLSNKALEDLLKDPAGKPCFENLSVQAQAEVLKVMEGFTGGTCTRCREGDGCLSCSRWKATRYWLQKDLYGASGAALYQKSKLQREAQLAAYPTKVAEALESQLHTAVLKLSQGLKCCFL